MLTHANEMPVELHSILILTQMGPHWHAVLADSDRTVRENIMTGLQFLGCKCCGTHDRHNQVAQAALAYFRYELKFTGSTSSVASGSNYASVDPYFCGWQEQAHRRTRLGEPLLAEKSGL
jgi:hypothetical protein